MGINLLYAAPSLKYGGAARVVVTWANYFASLPAFKVGVLVDWPDSIYKLDRSVDQMSVYRNCELKSSLLNKLLRRLLYWPRLLQLIAKASPDVIVSSQRGYNWKLIFAAKILGLPCILIEHTNYQFETGFFSFIERRLVYMVAEHLVVLSDFDYVYYSRFISRVSIIPNPLCFAPNFKVEGKENVVLAVGDFVRWRVKGFDLLLKAFSEISASFPDWRLVIASPVRDGMVELEEMAKSCGIPAGQVGFVVNPPCISELMKQSSVYCLSSRFEGFSLSLLEAMSQSCCCIAFDCVTGPRSLLGDGEYGCLVEAENVSMLADSMRNVLSTADIRVDYALRASHASRKYAVDALAYRWIDLFYQVLYFRQIN